MKRNLSSILLGAALSLAIAVFTSNAFAQGAGGASGGGAGAGVQEPAQVRWAVRHQVRPVRMCRAARESAR